MTKKEYQQPATRWIDEDSSSFMLCLSTVRDVNSNADINYGGGGAGPARSREHNHSVWDEGEEQN